MTNALERAVALAGSQSELARRIGVSKQRLAYWLTRNPPRPPAEMVFVIEGAIGIPRHELRPDLWPAPAQERPAEGQAA